MNIKELADQVNRQYPGITTASAAQVLRFALGRVKEEIEASPEGFVAVQGLGHFRVRNVTPRNETEAVRRTTFVADKRKAQAEARREAREEEASDA